MNTLIDNHQQVAVLFARVFLGLLFLFQGYDAVFKVKIKNVINTYQYSYQEKGLPKFITQIAITFTSVTHLICGLLLVLGLFKYYSLYLLGFNLVISSIGFAILTPMWDMRFAFPRFALILLLLLLPAELDIFSLDALICYSK